VAIPIPRPLLGPVVAAAAKCFSQLLFENHLDRFSKSTPEHIVDALAKPSGILRSGGRLGHGVILLVAVVAILLLKWRLRHFPFSTESGTDPILGRWIGRNVDRFT